MQKTLTINFATLAFIMLFFTETSYYLLILQTGIIEYFHSNISKIWMIPIGGVIGIIVISKVNYRSLVVSMALFTQIICMIYYPYFNGYILFTLGILSGLVAPYLIYQLTNVSQLLVILGLSYLMGTFAIHIPAEDRGVLAITLSLIAFLSSFFVIPVKKKKTKQVAIKTYISIFMWLVLDATLFETLSRSSSAIWGKEEFTLTIAIFHIVGLLIGYKLISFKHNNIVVFTLFIISYLSFAFNLLYLLAIVYPIVISYYNVIILKHFMQLSFEHLTLVSLSLWMSAGIGLFIALFLHNFI